MSSIPLNSRRAEHSETEWARLIPGETPVSPGARKPPKAVKASARNRQVAPASHPLEILMPGPLQSRNAWQWVRAMAADCALVGLDWLVVGALLVPLRLFFPGVRLFQYAAGAPNSMLGMAVLHAALITLIGHTEGLHAANHDRKQKSWILAKSVFLATAVLCVAYRLQGAPWSISVLFCSAGLLHFGALWMWRWQSYERSKAERWGDDTRNVLIVGASESARAMASKVEQYREAGRKVCGFLDDEKPLGNGVIGRVADLPRLARTGFVDEVILALPKDRELALRVVSEARRLRLDVEIVPDLFGCNPAGDEREQIGGVPLICLHAEKLPTAGLVVKRLIDVLGAGAVLFGLSPLLAVITVLIRLDSQGPVFYCAQRAGRKGRRFSCYKFRTMVCNADELKSALRQSNERTGPIFKIAGDPRITRLGRYLRRYSLDELPQLWNVVKGEMSLVGPRPHPVDEVAEYEIEHLARLDVTPGITGLWQVTARRDPCFQRGMELDREYIRTWSLGLDMRILLRTFLAVVHGSGD